jgi:uncharacterized protein YdiU (UPF0061 family)
MEEYDPQWTRNKTDLDKEFTFESQPSVVYWTLGRLGRTFLDLIGESHGKLF